MTVSFLNQSIFHCIYATNQGIMVIVACDIPQMITILILCQEMSRLKRRFLRTAWASAALLALALSTASPNSAEAQLTANERSPSLGDSIANPGPVANLSGALDRSDVHAAMRKVGSWQNAIIANAPSDDWTFATLYMGMLTASHTLQEARYHETVLRAAQALHWELGPRQTHADDQAIGQVYLRLYQERPDEERVAPTRNQLDAVIQLPDDPAKPVWWWCDALFMAPPVFAALSQETHDPKYLAYMDREWHITSNLLWDPQEKLFSRDASYLSKHEKNGRKVFWSRGNGWVMGGIVGVLEHMPLDDPRRGFYVNRLQQMAESIRAIQGKDGLWRTGLLDAAAYPEPEVSGSAFFVYAITWGIDHGILDTAKYGPVVTRGWAGLVQHIYADGRLGDIQPVGEAPGAYTPGSSYVFGIGAFLLAGSEIDTWLASNPRTNSTTSLGKQQ